MQRIIKQYEDTIRLHKAGKPIETDTLPTLPGFCALPESVSPGIHIFKYH
jgi:coiled-coil and C2 domain-containing protein 1